VNNLSKLVFNNISKHKLCYKNSYKYGSLNILGKYLGIEDSILSPINISHGVDFNHMVVPQDIQNPAPIHWSYNSEIYERAKKIKQTLLLPHPFSILHKQVKSKIIKNNKYLLVAPAGSKINNENLLKIIKSRYQSPIDILIKDRGFADDDQEFWHSHGFKTVSAGNNTESFYSNLYKILSNYDHVIGCTASSAIVFASAIGTPCSIISDFKFRVNEVTNYHFDFTNSWAKLFFTLLINDQQEQACGIAKQYLGFNLNHDVSYLRKTIFQSLEDIKEYIYIHENKHKNIIKKFLYRSTGKIIFIHNNSLHLLFQKIISTEKILEVTKNEIDIILNEKNKNNYSQNISQLTPETNRPGSGF